MTLLSRVKVEIKKKVEVFMLASYFVLTFKYKKLLLFGFIGVLTALIGFGLLDFFVKVGRFDANIAFWLQLIIVFQINFNLNDKLTWNSNKAAQDKYFTRLKKYHAYRAVSLIGSQVFFSSMYFIADIAYDYLFVIDSIIWMVYNFRVGENRIFKVKTGV